MYIVIALMLFIACGTFVMHVLFSRQCKHAHGFSVRISKLQEEIGNVSLSVDKSMAYIPSMAPLAEFVIQQTELEKLVVQFTQSKDFCKELNEKLTSSKRDVEKKELKQKQIKAKRNECIDKATEIIANKDDLESEFVRLQMELEQSHSQMSSLSDEVELKNDQKRAIEEISKTLTSSKQQLSNLKEHYTEASDRFISIEHQYQELEAEYARLVEREIEKNPWMKRAS